MKKMIVVWIMASLLFIPAARAVSVMPPPVAQGEKEVGLQFDLQNTIEYEAAQWGSGEAERQILSIYGAYKMAFLTVGFINKSTVESRGWEGDGTALGLGVRQEVWHQDANGATLYGAFNYFKEEYDIGVSEPAPMNASPDDPSYNPLSDLSGKVEFEGKEISVGGVLSHRAEKFTLYGGLEIVPYSDLDLEGVSVDRSDIFTLRAGGIMDLEGFLLSADIQLIGAETIRLGVAHTF